MFERLLLAGLCLVVLAGGCGRDRTTAKRSDKPRRTVVYKEVSYKDKTPDEWLRQLRARSRQGREQAIDALLQYGAIHVPAIVEVLNDRSLNEARLSAARALGAFGSKAEAAVPALVGALQDTKWTSRDGAAMALGKIRGRLDETLPALVQALGRDSDERVRAAAAEALGKIADGRPAVVSALVKALDDGAINVQAEAAEALEKIGPKAREALPALQKAARSKEFVVSQAANEAIKAIGGG